MIFIFLEGTKRAGNHAFTEWLAGQSGPLAHGNNYFYQVDEETDNPSRGGMEKPFDAFLQDAIRHFNENRTRFCAISFEHPGRLDADQVKTIFDTVKSELPVSGVMHLHILRDPFNWMGSFARMRATVNCHGLYSEQRATDAQTAENFTQHHENWWQRWLRSYDLWCQLPESSRINYNYFCSSADYRKALANRFDLNWKADKDARNMGTLAPQGSSFQSDAANISDNVLQRYRTILPLLRRYPVPPEIWNACAITFPEVAYRVRQDLEA